MRGIGILVLLVSAFLLGNRKTQQAERGGEEHPQKAEVVQYAKEVDVHILDDTLPHEPLESYLGRVVPSGFRLVWTTSDCDLKPSFPRPASHPLCASVRGRCGYSELRCEVRVGTHGHAIDGKPTLMVLWVSWYEGDDPEREFQFRPVAYLADLSSAFNDVP